MDEVVCVSEGVKQSVLNLHPVLESNISVIYNPVDTTLIAAKGQGRVSRLAVGLNVLAIGRLLNSQKAFDLPVGCPSSEYCGRDGLSSHHSW